MEVLQRTANRGSIATGAASYDIANSLKFESDNGTGETLYALPWSSAGTRTTHTWSIWVKRTELGTRQMLLEGAAGITATTQLSLSFQTNDALEVRVGEFVPGSQAGTVYRLTNRVFRDTSAWYHIVAAFDTTQATANNRIKIWINGVQETSFATIANPAQNTDLAPFAANAQQTVAASGNNGFYYNGYITHAALVYNQQLDADSFGEFDSDSGIWKPIDLENLTFGAFGFWLKFENSSFLGKDSSGNNHGFTTPNISSADQATDTPTNNFCTLNILEPDTSNQLTYTEGATKVTSLGASPYPTSKGTLGVQNGKWYFELKAGTMNYSSQVGAVGLALPEHISASYPHDNAGAYVYRSNGDKLTQGSTTSYGDAWSTNDIIGVAIDLDNNTLSFYRNNTSQGQAFTGLTETYLPAIYADGTTLEVNFGGYTSFTISSSASDANGYGTFEYAPPSGYYALCTKNLAEYG